MINKHSALIRILATFWLLVVIGTLPLTIPVSSQVFASETAQESKVSDNSEADNAYYILYSEEGKLYAISPDTSSEPILLGPDFPVPSEFLVEADDKIPSEEMSLDVELTDGYSFANGLLAPSGRAVVYVEAICTNDHCHNGYNVWLVDLEANRSELLFDEETGEAGRLPKPVAWNEENGTLFFDTYDTDHHAPFAGIWRYDLETDKLSQLELGDGAYNGRLWLSPDNQYLLTTGFAERSADPVTARGRPTARIKVIDVTNETVLTVADTPKEREYSVRGWISSDSLSEIAELAEAHGEIVSPSLVPEATSGFQRPMTNDHYGYQWLQWTGSVYHPAEDYNGPGAGNSDCGTNVLAVANGIVRDINLGNWGTMVVEHNWQGTTVYSQYGHLSSALVSEGQTVNKGQHIGEVGNVGATTCHLHWEIREGDHPNPTYAPYYTTSVLNNQSHVENYYESPEWWVDNHGPYTSNGDIIWDFGENSGQRHGWVPNGMECEGFWGWDFWVLYPRISGDPWIVKDGLYLDNTQYWAVQIRMMSEVNTAHDNIFWRTSNSNYYSGDKSRPLPVTADGQWHTYTIRVGDHAKWMHYITGIRIDPTGDGESNSCIAENHIFVDWVKLLKDNTAPTNPTSVNPGCTATSNVWQNTCSNPNFTWSGANDGQTSVSGYYYYWGTSNSGNPTTWTTSASYNPGAISSGQTYYLRVKTKDQGGNVSAAQTLFVLKYDGTAPSNPTSVNPGCTATSNVWQNTCSNPNFSWSGATDSHSGIQGYYYYWGSSSSGDPTTWTTSAGYNPGAISSGQTYYLRLKSKDQAGNVSAAQTLFVLKYDGTAPSSTADSPQNVTSGNIPVSWTANDSSPGSGLANTVLWYKYGSGGTWTNTALSETGNSGTFNFIPAAGDGTYFFATRSTDHVGNIEATPTGDGDDSTLYQTAPPCYTLTTASDPTAGGSINASPAPNCGDGYEEGTTVTLTANPNANYSFSNWSGDASGSSNPASVTMDSNKSVTAHFNTCYTLTLASNPSAGGTIDASPSPNCAGGKYEEGTTVTLTANPNTGYTFDNWSGAANSTNSSTTILMNGSQSVTAHFSQNPTCYTLTLASDPVAGGTIDASPSSNCAGGKYEEGTAVMLTANANSDYTFTGWSGDASGVSNPASVTIDSNKSVTAHFDTGPVVEPTISDVRATNVRDVSFTVSWLTDIAASGEVHYGTDPNNLDQTADDLRGAATSDDTHYVLVDGLQPNTTYYFDVVSNGVTDDNDGTHYSITTGSTLGVPGSDTIYGQVRKSDGSTLAVGTIVYITLQDANDAGSSGEAAPLSALVDDDGYWFANLADARLADLSNYFTYSASGDQIRLQAEGAADGHHCGTTVDTADDSPATALVLSNDSCAISWTIDLELGWNNVALPLEPSSAYTVG